MEMESVRNVKTNGPNAQVLTLIYVTPPSPYNRAIMHPPPTPPCQVVKTGESGTLEWSEGILSFRVWKHSEMNSWLRNISHIRNFHKVRQRKLSGERWNGKRKWKERVQKWGPWGFPSLHQQPQLLFSINLSFHPLRPHHHHHHHRRHTQNCFILLYKQKQKGKRNSGLQSTPIIRITRRGPWKCSIPEK